MDRDFDKEKILDKMRELRDKRDLELLNQDLENVNLNSDYQKEVSKNKVLDVKYIGTIEIDGEPKDIYLLIEQKEEKDGSLAEIEKYYTEDGEFLGGDSNLDQFDFITLKKEYADKVGLLKQLENLDKKGILDLNDIENERLEELARELGIDVKDIEKLAEIDAEKELDKWHEELTNEQIEELQEEGIEPGDEEYRRYLLDHGLSLPKEEVEEGISTKTEIKTGQKVTDKDTMASLLNVEDKGYVKIAVVYSDKLQDNGNTTRFSFVGIKPDGSAEKIDTLEQAYGSNPTKNVQTLNKDGSKIEEDKVNSIFRIKGKDEEQLAVNIGQMGTIEPKFVRTPRQDGEKAISIPIETQNIRPTTRETMKFMNRSRNTDISNNIKLAQEHEKIGCKEATVKDIDNDKNNNTHEHGELSQEFLNRCTEILLEKYGDIYNRDDITGKLLKLIEENGKEVLEEEFLKMATEKIGEDAELEHPQHQRRK